VLLENELKLSTADAYTVTPGHSLVIPPRHLANGIELHQPEWNAVVELGVAPEMKVIIERPRLKCHLKKHQAKGSGP
jgi:diadenosine tetraphosphate (Ap4A) HIT family hydrolase